MKSHGHRSKKHGRRRRESITYVSWRMMIQRCLNPKRSDYENYGGRGITVHFLWQSPGGFTQFLEDVGPRPSKKYSLDRIKADGNYEPGNVRWATKSVQNSNKASFIIEFNGERLTMYEWAARLNLHPGALRKRFHRRWSKERALTTMNPRGKRL